MVNVVGFIVGVFLGVLECDWDCGVSFGGMDWESGCAVLGLEVGLGAEIGCHGLFDCDVRWCNCC
jgi:hypothetical protein